MGDRGGEREKERVEKQREGDKQGLLWGQSPQGVCVCVCVLGGCTHMWMHVCNHSQTLNDIVGDLWREWQTHGYLGDAKIFTQRGKKKKNCVLTLCLKFQRCIQ